MFYRSFSPPKKIAPPEEPFPYPDPVLVGGDHAFNVRLTELARLQKETIKNEELCARIARRNAAIATSSSATSLQATRQPLRPSSSVTRPSATCKAGLNRKTSLPAPTVQDTPSSPPSQCSQSTRKLPVPTKRSCNSNDAENDSKAFVHDSAEQTGIEMDPTSSKSNEKTPVKPSQISSASQCSIEHNDEVQVSTAVESKTVILDEVPPKTHHRELVNAIFSREKQTRQTHREHADTDDTGTTCRAKINLESRVRLGAGSTASPQQSPDSDTRMSHSTPQQKSTSPNAHMNSSNEVSSHSNSSVSSSSITSEHASPSHDSGKKSRAKPSKPRKHSKKTARHKHT